MSSEILFFIILGIVIASFLFEQILDYLNYKKFNDPIPNELHDVYDKEEYEKSQKYKITTYRFGLLSSWISFSGIVLFLIFDGFALVNQWAYDITSQPILVALIFFGILGLASDILSTPFTYYSTFVIEEKFGFNKTTKKTFWLDKLKGWLVGAILGSVLIGLIIWFFEKFPDTFWIYAWILISVFSIFMNLFYTKIFVPLFNKQAPLEKGQLREKIEQYAKKVGFQINKIFVIDGSKRSTKANAYFSGFGSQKQITLYDTLVNDLKDEEIVAVLAHEVGHYKHRHIIYNLSISILSTGFTLWLLSLLIGSPLIYEALGVINPGFHIGLIAFGLLYTPISTLTSFLMNILSRKFEYQADDYAANTYASKHLLNALKKLSKKSLSNLTPHPLYVKVHYSHPSLLQRTQNLKKYSL